MSSWNEEIIQAISDDKTKPFIQPEQLAQIMAFTISNYHPSLPSNLDEAAEEYSNTPYNFGDFVEIEYEFGEPIEKNVDDKMFVKEAFKAGAEWAAGQSYTDEVKYSDLEGRKYVFVPYEEFNPGDKVVVQIRKK